MKESIKTAEKFLTDEQKKRVERGEKISLTLDQVINIFGYTRAQLERPIAHNVVTSPDLIGCVETLEDLTGKELHLYEQIHDLNEQESYLTVCKFFVAGECPTKVKLALFGKA